MSMSMSMSSGSGSSSAGGGGASSNSPCAACKFLRRKCTQECIFAPYFPPDQPQKFASVHKVFGASNVAKLLKELTAAQREDAVNSLAYEAEERLRDPVYGCVGLISILQHRLKQLHHDLDAARKELANYIGPHHHAMLSLHHHHHQHMIGNGGVVTSSGLGLGNNYEMQTDNYINQQHNQNQNQNNEHDQAAQVFFQTHQQERQRRHMASRHHHHQQEEGEEEEGEEEELEAGGDRAALLMRPSC
ncbi:unnamed protein product [Linum tenue]|uniref:LOB domain-containing protein n=1 Tax=Linum tenue TaxID=586396 RepID=A0AAV0L5P1_9ROSI|nr:unnamed protein product [Linum tenue]